MGVSIMRRGQAVQRIRITYGVDGALVYASVLDMGRLWERLLRRAGVPLVYSQGFNPHPRLQFASPLPVGYSSECEVLDIWLAEQQDMAFAQRLMAAQAPKGLLVTRVEEVALDAPVLQAEVRRARYRVRLCTPMSGADLQVAFDRLLSTATLPRQRMKKGRMATYDLRPLVDQLVLASDEGGCYSIEMLLCAGAPGSGRPEEVIDALSVDVQDLAIRRTALLWGNGREDRP
jgi:radical SAM-linked protein